MPQPFHPDYRYGPWGAGARLLGANKGIATVRVVVRNEITRAYLVKRNVRVPWQPGMERRDVEGEALKEVAIIFRQIADTIFEIGDHKSV